jgi:hypothetical protein
VPLMDATWSPSQSMYAGYAYDRFMEDLLRFLAPWIEDPWRQPSRTATMLLLGLLTGVVMPFTFVLLPHTLAKAQVRHAHLVRIVAWWMVALPLVTVVPSVLYSLLVLLAWVDSTYFHAPTYQEHTLIERYSENLDLFTLGVLMLWTGLWWRTALERYLRLPTPWSITLAMLTIAFLISLGLCMLEPGMRYHIALRV